MSSPPTSRRDARERALELLYESESKSVSVVEVIRELPLPPDAYAALLATGVGANQAQADALITKFARNDWSIERLPMIDRIVLRLAIYELSHQHDVPRGVVLDEAVELAKTFSTEESGSFVNGMLTSIANELGR